MPIANHDQHVGADLKLSQGPILRDPARGP